MNTHLPYGTNIIFHALSQYKGDPYFAQDYGALVQEELNKGLDLLFNRESGGSGIFFRYLILLYARKQYCGRIFHLGQAAQLLLWMNRTYTSSTLEHLPALIQQTCEEIEHLHSRWDTWQNPAICSSTIRHIERNYATVNLTQLSKQLGINASYLSRVLSQNFHATFLDLVHTKRILTALDIFLSAEFSPQLATTAADLGYSSEHYFYCVFKRYTGLTPSVTWNLIRA